MRDGGMTLLSLFLLSFFAPNAWFEPILLPPPLRCGLERRECGVNAGFLLPPPGRACYSAALYINEAVPVIMLQEVHGWQVRCHWEADENSQGSFQGLYRKQWRLHKVITPLYETEGLIGIILEQAGSSLKARAQPHDKQSL